MMNSNRNMNLPDILGIALAPFMRFSEPVVDVESETVPARTSTPMPVKAIFNLKTEDMVPVLDENGEPVWESAGENQPKRKLKQAKTLEKPILASKVFFEDGSWTVVKNSGEDTIDVEEKTLPDGRTVKVASDASKERAIAYAVVKRAFGRVSPTGEVKSANLGRRFEKVLKNSVDQNAGSAESKNENAEDETERKTKPKQHTRRCRQIDEKRLKETLDLLGEFVKKLDLGKAVDGTQQGA